MHIVIFPYIQYTNKTRLDDVSLQVDIIRKKWIKKGCNNKCNNTIARQKFLSGNRIPWINLQCKSTDWFLYYKFGPSSLLNLTK